MYVCLCVHMCTHVCADAWGSEGDGRNLFVTLCLLFHGAWFSPECEACDWGGLKAIGPSDLLRTVVTGMFWEVRLLMCAKIQVLASWLRSKCP